MDFSFALGLVAGFLLWPWWAMSLFALVCVVDVVCLECEAEGWGTGILIIGVAALAWLAADVNVFAWVWANLTNIVKFLLAYFFVGAIWSVAKWYFFLLKVREGIKAIVERDGIGETTRPWDSYASRNKGRILSWIGHWPLSMIGTLFGDVLTRIVKSVYNILSGLYDKIGDSVFAEFQGPEKK